MSVAEARTELDEYLPPGSAARLVGGVLGTTLSEVQVMVRVFQGAAAAAELVARLLNTGLLQDQLALVRRILVAAQDDKFAAVYEGAVSAAMHLDALAYSAEITVTDAENATDIKRRLEFPEVPKPYRVWLAFYAFHTGALFVPGAVYTRELVPLTRAILLENRQTVN